MVPTWLQRGLVFMWDPNRAIFLLFMLKILPQKPGSWKAVNDLRSYNLKIDTKERKFFSATIRHGIKSLDSGRQYDELTKTSRFLGSESITRFHYFRGRYDFHRTKELWKPTRTADYFHCFNDVLMDGTALDYRIPCPTIKGTHKLCLTFCSVEGGVLAVRGNFGL